MHSMPWKQQCVIFTTVVICIVKPHVLLSTIWNTLGLCVKCPIFFSGFHQIWIFWTDISESLQYQISHKAIQWEPSWHMWTSRSWADKCGPADRHDKAIRHFWQQTQIHLKNLGGIYNLETQTNSHLSDNNFPNGWDYKIKKETAPTALS
jgi:hypothetical protein